MMPDLDDLPEIWKKAIRTQTGKELGTGISAEEITHLDFEMDGLESIEPVRLFPALMFLNISTTGISDLSPLIAVPKLRTLYADMCDFDDLSDLAGLSSLVELDVSCTRSGELDLEPLRSLRALETLYISSNRIKSLDPIMATELKLLDVLHTGLSEEEIAGFAFKHPKCEIWKD